MIASISSIRKNGETCGGKHYEILGVSEAHISEPPTFLSLSSIFEGLKSGLTTTGQGHMELVCQAPLYWCSQYH